MSLFSLPLGLFVARAERVARARKAPRRENGWMAQRANDMRQKVFKEKH